MMLHKPFLWGAVTSAHQVEGYTYHNDWWEHAKKKPQLVTPGPASGHYERWSEDIDLAATLGHNAHRLSLEWSRLEPVPGQFSAEAVAHYRQVLEKLRAKGLTTVVTLHHFTNPIWFSRQGGWQNLGAVAHFGRYVAYVVDNLGDLVDIWLTIHEPVMYAIASHTYPAWPQVSIRWRGTTRLIATLARSHRLAYRIIHAKYPTAVVAVPLQYEPTLQRETAFINATRKTHDAVALNWERNSVPLGDRQFQQTLAALKVAGLPILITADGLATDNDQSRAEYIRQQLRAIEAAQAEGMPIYGYLYRSFLDGYEWTAGFEPHYGLVAVDRTSLARQPRPSAYVLKAIIEQRTI